MKIRQKWKSEKNENPKKMMKIRKKWKSEKNENPKKMKNPKKLPTGGPTGADRGPTGADRGHHKNHK